MNHKYTITSFLLCVAVAGCGQSTVDIEAETAALRAAADKYHEAGSAADTATVASFLAADGLVMPPNEPSVTGPAGFEEYAEAFTGLDGFSMSFEEPIIAVSAGGDMGYTLADTIIGFDGPDGARVEDRLRDFHLWTKEDGEWKVSVDIWNSENPLPDMGSASPLDGAWVVTGLTSPAGDSVEQAGPSQFIFSDGRYSAVYTVGVTERQKSEKDFAPTDKEKVSQYDTLIVNSGTYEIDGNRVTMRPTVAKTPEFIGGRSTMEFALDGDTMSATIVDLVSADGEAPADGAGSTMTLRKAN